ncbi:hypothetical protein SAMN04515680_0455 [Leifsonia sp. 21MFCrub1.1]|nr:hypothetical protein SAMN04515680_0455 [Leifsonia sp. 21MFCrub1.1]
MRAAAVALSVAGGLGLFACTATGAGADTGSGAGGTGDGSLRLIPEVISNEGISAGGHADFPVTGRLFLPEVEDRARQAEQSKDALARAGEKLAFDRTTGPATTEQFAETRGRLFQDYSHQAIPGAERRSAPQGADVWLVVLVVAATPLAGLAAFLGLRRSSRRASRHA